MPNAPGGAVRVADSLRTERLGAEQQGSCGHNKLGTLHEEHRALAYVTGTPLGDACEARDQDEYVRFLSLPNLCVFVRSACPC